MKNLDALAAELDSIDATLARLDRPEATAGLNGAEIGDGRGE